MRQTYILFEPQHEYAAAIMGYLARTHGLKPVCVYLSSKAEVYQRRHFPDLGPERVEASFFLDRMAPADIAAHLNEHYEVLGVVPYAEQTLAPAAALLQHLSVSWNNPALLRLFRDKAALKATLRREHPEIRLNEARLVHTVADVFAAPLPARYVLKPNDGFANRDVGFFEHHSPRAQVVQYFAGGPQGAYILEGFLEGPEYAINGQMDAQGQALVLSIAEYERVHANGKRNLYHWMHHLPQNTALFAELRDYAVNVMQALGLKRCPFHMETIRTAEGPVLVEVGARLGGTRTALATSELHGNGVDALAMAAHAYLFDTPYPGPVADWDHYNRTNYMHLDGIADKTERIYSVEGLAAVERLPHFRAWVMKPEVGMTVQRTQDLYQIPWSFYMVGEATREELRALGEQAKGLIKFNRRVTMGQKLATDVYATARSAGLRGRWWMNRALRT